MVTNSCTLQIMTLKRTIPHLVTVTLLRSLLLQVTSHLPQVFYFVLQSFNLNQSKDSVKPTQPRSVLPEPAPAHSCVTKCCFSTSFHDSHHWQTDYPPFQKATAAGGSLPGTFCCWDYWLWQQNMALGAWRDTASGRQPLLVPLWLLLLCCTAHVQREKY